MMQWLLERSVKLAQYGQGIGAGAKRKVDRAVLRHLPANAVVFDVGANRGQFLELALRKAAVHVHAFEPSSAAFSELAKRVNGRSDVVLNQVALGSEAGERTLYYDVPGSELSSLYARKIEHHGIHLASSETVRVETLDGYCAARGIECIDLLKLDVEGHELEALKGAERMLADEKIALVSFEFGGAHVDARAFFRDFFEFFSLRRMQLARVTAMGGLRAIVKYEEALEQFRTTCFVARPASSTRES